MTVTHHEPFTVRSISPTTASPTVTTRATATNSPTTNSTATRQNSSTSTVDSPVHRTDPESATPLRSLVVVSNRLPVSRVDDGWVTSAGGLVAALGPVLANQPSAWVGWSGVPDEEHPRFLLDDLDLVPVPLTSEEVAAYYDGLSNATLWPLYHHAVRPSVLDQDDWWPAYQDVNRRMAQAAADVAAEGAVVWIHDYHLQLVPALLRELRPDLRIGFFLHIPFPPPQLFQRLPWRDDLIEGLLGADLVGFQTEGDADNFRSVIHDSPADGDGRHLMAVGDRTVETDAFPISIDVDRCVALARDPAVRGAAAVLRRQLSSPRLILLGIDRLDYTKGIPERLAAFERYLERHPERAGDVVLVQVAAPSRERVDEYDRLRQEVERLVGHLNGKLGSVGRPVVHYIHQDQAFEEVMAFYLAADVMLVTPLADGMNLVAKEFVVARDGQPATLVISEFAGAVEELGPDSIVVNAFDVESMVAGLEQVDKLSDSEQRSRMSRMALTVTDHDVHRWAATFLDRLSARD